MPGPNGPVDADELGFRPLNEPWTEYLLDDGTVVRLKLVVTAAYRLEDQYDTEGNPVYVLTSTNVLKVSAPDNLRKGESS